MALEEREHAVPRVLRVGGELLVLAVEEAVWGAVVDHELVLDSRVGERPLERLVVLGGDVWSAPACRARTGACICDANCSGPGAPSRSPGRP